MRTVDIRAELGVKGIGPVAIHGDSAIELVQTWQKDV